MAMECYWVEGVGGRGRRFGGEYLANWGVGYSGLGEVYY